MSALDNYPNIDRGTLISTTRAVTLNTSWVGCDLPTIVEIRVHINRKLYQMWSGHSTDILAFKGGKTINYFKFPNGDIHKATRTFRVDPVDGVGYVILTKKQKHSGSDCKWNDYFSTSKTQLTLNEWESVIELVEYVHDANESIKPTKELNNI